MQSNPMGNAVTGESCSVRADSSHTCAASRLGFVLPSAFAAAEQPRLCRVRGPSERRLGTEPGHAPVHGLLSIFCASACCVSSDISSSPAGSPAAGNVSIVRRKEILACALFSALGDCL